MSIVVNYPAKINGYTVTVSNTKASIRLLGVENGGNENERFIGDVSFLENDSNDVHTKAFINRGGFLNMSYPISLLPSILMLLNQTETLYVDGEGNFTNRGILK